MNYLQTPITLPCGAVLSNRLTKSAMTERISNRDFEPTSALVRLYELWAQTGAGLLISGNVMIDAKHLESAGNLLFNSEEMIPKLQPLAAAGTSRGNHFWVQISHSGRQTSRLVNTHPKAPSEVQLHKIGLFGKPKEMSQKDIEEVIVGFRKAARIAKAAGFTGVQIHSAHGYLLSQFLSPRTNLREDKWGGSLENRSRLLLQIIREVRAEVGIDFPVSVKLNSSDFQKGGFSEEDSLQVVRLLEQEGIDLLEISGGTYENVVFLVEEEDTRRESTKRREAYFLNFAGKVRAISQLPILITGGFRSFDFCNQVLEAGEADLIGMARPFITHLEGMAAFLEGKIPVLEIPKIRTGMKAFEDSAEAGYYAKQLIRIAEGKGLKQNMGPIEAAFFIPLHEFKKGLEKKSR
ncbi:NADH:flavin oxidoreductase/NADH oxidase family protein [Algoriphagus taiwanensis]|uniref:NADH:flavin oxidoreductase/NADH oxidase family protein n=1 Tax=Algoriphagus taiwanensis TaxID=1445656 RepID=A0ABQ6Q550_9BACT|nr:NADH:flavin oxidoreductase/NADH oxidase family protein [Algoriphagus taiwanensis]